jgi:uncharacterized protein (DUF433 family)
MDIMEEKDYFRRYVELLRKSVSSEHYFNHFPWQALIVIENILEYALDNKNDVHIFTGSFFEVYGETILDRIKKVALNGIKIEIILAEHPGIDDQKLRDLAAIKNVKIYYMDKYNDKLNHIWLAGESYRFELPHSKINTKITETTPECPAQFAFHNKEEASMVSKYWEQIKNSHNIEPLQAA